MATYTRTQRLQDSILSVKPLSTESFSEVEVYAYQSRGAPPNVIHANDPLITPDGTALSGSALFFQATIQNAQNPPTFSQLAIDGIGSMEKKAITVASSNVVSTTATISITCAGHGLVTNDLADIDIGDTSFNTNPNGVHTITRVDDNNFTYTITVDSGTSNDTYTISSDAFMSKAVLVHEYRDYYQVTDPGTVACEGVTSSVTIGSEGGTASGTATVFPKITQERKTYRKSGLTKIFLTALSRPTPEVAYQNENIEFCSIHFRSSTSISSGAASADASHKVFNGYLKGDTDKTPSVSVSGKFSASAASVGNGSTPSSYVYTGVFQSKITPFNKSTDGQVQYFLKTDVIF